VTPPPQHTHTHSAPLLASDSAPISPGLLSSHDQGLCSNAPFKEAPSLTKVLLSLSPTGQGLSPGRGCVLVAEQSWHTVDDSQGQLKADRLAPPGTTSLSSKDQGHRASEAEQGLEVPFGPRWSSQAAYLPAGCTSCSHLHPAPLSVSASGASWSGRRLDGKQSR
jgi:hypothetical protein